MAKNFSLIKTLNLATLVSLTIASSTSALEAEDYQKKYYFQLNTGASYATIPKGDFGDTKSSSWSSLFGVEFGYKLNDQLRASLDISYRPNLTPKNTTLRSAALSHNGHTESSDTFYNTKYQIKSISAMINLNYDIMHINNITPYLAAGLGFTRNTVKENEIEYSNHTSDGKLTSTRPVQSHIKSTKNSFAYKLGLGARYTLTQGFDLDLKYQYVDLGKIRAGCTINSPTENGKLNSHEIMLGIVYKF